MNVSRRGFIKATATTLVSLLIPGKAATAATQGRRGHKVKPAYILSGGATTDGILVHSTLSPQDRHAAVNLAVSRYPSMAQPSYVGTQQADEDSIVRHTVGGRQPNTTYYAKLWSEGKFVGETIRFKTLPASTGSWTRSIAVVSCMANASDQFSTELAWQDVLEWSPDDIWHLGDWGYWGGLIRRTASYRKDLYHYLRTMRHFNVMRNAIQRSALNVVAISDHELTTGGDPNDGMLNSQASIRELVAFQKLMPVRSYGDTRTPRRGRYYSYDIGNQVRVIVTDFRSPDRSNSRDPDGPAKTMFGATQLSWLFSQLDSTKVNLIVNETAWLADPDQRGRGHDKPWFYNYEQKIIANHITQGGYKVAWIGGDRHYVGYLAGQGTPHNTLGNFPCYISSGMSKNSLDLQQGELMTWQHGAGHAHPSVPVCGYMRITLSFNAATNQVTINGHGRAVLDTSPHRSQWQISDIPGGTATDTWTL